MATKLDQQTVETCRTMCTEWLTKHNLTPAAILTGADAWTVAARSDMTHMLYADRTVTDGHIQTVLEKIFPNAVFKDKKVY
jgi:hypothetical protein